MGRAGIQASAARGVALGRRFECRQGVDTIPELLARPGGRFTKSEQLFRLGRGSGRMGQEGTGKCHGVSPFVTVGAVTLVGTNRQNRSECQWLRGGLRVFGMVRDRGSNPLSRTMFSVGF